MKFLLVNDDYTSYGGVQQYVLSVTALLEKYGHQVVIAYLDNHKYTIKNDSRPVYWLSPPHQSMQLNKVIKQENPDFAYIQAVSSPSLIENIVKQLPTVAYIHGFQTVCAGLAKYFRRNDQVCSLPLSWACFPLHYTHRCSSARNPKTVLKLMKEALDLQRAYQTVSRILVSTPYMQNLLIQNQFNPTRISLLPPHFLSSKLPPLIAPQETNSILFAGRLEIEKGLPYLLHAFRKIPQSTKLLIAGDGSQRANYEALTHKLKLSNQIKFMGWLDQEALYTLYQTCSFLAMPSIFPETFGKSGIEALTHGRPVVAFDIGSIPYWLQHGKTGFIVPPKNIEELANKITYLLQHKPICEEMGRHGQQYVSEHFAEEQHLITLLSLCQSFI